LVDHERGLASNDGARVPEYEVAVQDELVLP
jgi:hypothetical protein